MSNNPNLQNTTSSTPAMTLGDRGFVDRMVPDYTITRFKSGTIIWLNPKAVGSPAIVKVDKKGKLYNLESAGYNHPALILKQELIPGCLRVNETYIVLQVGPRLYYVTTPINLF
jgi:hypothetical protein